MELQDIKLTNFKNYSEGGFIFHPKLNVIVGLNGRGKTNLMDAIYYLCMGKSYFSTLEKNVVRHDQTFFRLDGKIDGCRVEIKSQLGRQKEILLNGGSFNKLTDYVGKHPIVVVAPDDIYQLFAVSENRRIFINNTLVQYDNVYLRELLSYNRLLKQRNALLKSFQQEKRQNLVLLDTITNQMAGPAKYISAARKQFIDEIGPVFQSHYQIISGDREQAGLGYSSEPVETSWTDIWKKDLQKDLITARTNSGVHKDDLEMFLNDKAVKDFASQGQTKSYVLALKFSQYEVLKSHSGKKPILLLDDVFDKLDPSRMKFLLDHVTTEEFGQVFISDTDDNKVPDMLGDISQSFQKFSIQ